MISVTVRRATEADCPGLLGLVKGLAEYEKAPEQVTISLQEFREAGFGKDRVWDAFVAEADGDLIGFALWYIRFSTWKGKRLYLEDIYIEPEYRSKGVGSKLFEALLAETRRLGLGGMVWQVLEWNESAISFYRNHGAALDGEWINCSLEVNP